MKQPCVDLQAIIVQIEACLKMPICTVGAIINMFKTGALMNLLGRGHGYILPARIIMRMVNEASIFKGSKFAV